MPPQHAAQPDNRGGSRDDPSSGVDARDFQFVTRCRILRKIADGGMGSVYLGEQLGEGGFAKTVALKFIKPERLANPDHLQNFAEEAQLVADLVHTNIAQVYNLASYHDRLFIVMEYLHGKTLSAYLKFFRQKKELPDVEMSAFIVSRVCRGLDYAHTKRDRTGQPLGIVHRDVTPSNIMMDFRGAVKLTDFGIAKALTMHMPDETQTIMGKLPYMSPEQAAAKGTDARSDLYSLGLILYELLTLTQVYVAHSRSDLLQMMTRFKVRDPRKIIPSLPDGLVEIVMRSLQRNPDKRYQTAREFSDTLETYMYSKGYGPTNEKLADHLLNIWIDIDRDRIE
jgi:serine/threonine-protein kinase